MFRVYYYGLRKWDNYLLDIDEDIRNAGDSTQTLARESKSLHASVRGGFEGLRTGIEGLQTGIEDLRAEFQWGFSLLADRMDTQISIMADIARKLDTISAALDAPLDKQARELYRQGVDRLRDGLDNKALERFLQSEEKNDVDFSLQLYIGKLYLYGNGTRDLKKATEHLLAAARYAEAKRGRIDDWNRYAAEAYFHAAVAAYVEGEKTLGDGSPNDLGQLLEMALGFLAKAGSLWPEFLEIAYTRAKCSALLRRWEGVKECFEFLGDRDRRYFLKATEDRDFDGLRDLVKEIEHETIARPGPLAQQIAKKFELTAEALNWAKRGAAQGDENRASVKSAEGRIAEAKRAYETHDSDLVAMDLQLDTEIHSLFRMTDASLTSRIKAAQDGAAKNEAVRNGAKLEIENRKSSMSEQYGCGTGCLFALLVPFIFGILTVTLSPLLFGDSQSRNAFEVAMESVLFFVALLAGLIGTLFSRSRLRAPYRSEIAIMRAALAKCDQDGPALAEEVAQGYKELSDFRAWRDGIVPVQSGHGDRKVTLSSVGPNRIETIKLIREVTGLDLKEAVDLADTVPSTVLWGVSRATAEKAVSKFQAAGATASMEQMRSWSRTS